MSDSPSFCLPVFPEESVERLLHEPVSSDVSNVVQTFLNRADALWHEVCTLFLPVFQTSLVDSGALL